MPYFYYLQFFYSQKCDSIIDFSHWKRKCRFSTLYQIQLVTSQCLSVWVCKKQSDSHLPFGTDHINRTSEALGILFCYSHNVFTLYLSFLHFVDIISPWFMPCFKTSLYNYYYVYDTSQTWHERHGDIMTQTKVCNHDCSTWEDGVLDWCLGPRAPKLSWGWGPSICTFKL